MSSTIPAAVEALFTLFSTAATALSDTDLAVIDGDPIDPPRKFLCVGWDESDQPAVSNVLLPNNASMATAQETYEVTNLLTVWSGGETAAQLRTDAFALFDVFRSALLADPTLGGVVSSASVSSLEYTPGSRVEGVLAQIRFSVQCSAFGV